MLRMLNIGCGHRYHKDWENIDVEPASDEVKKVNIIKGLPYPDNSYDVVYHSNVLEHLPRTMGEDMTRECYRVLKPGGVLRINVPDLEKICREYITSLEKASSGNESASYDYDWILIEMLDQVSRNKSGGEMAEYLSQSRVPNPDYLRHRLGDYYDNWRNSMETPRKKKSISEKIKFVLKHPDRLKRVWHSLVLSRKEREFLNIGKFRLGGEVHYHMYDRFSLEKLLRQIGFKRIEVKDPVQSNIKGWSEYKLDYPNDGAGLFIEAIK